MSKIINLEEFKASRKPDNLDDIYHGILDDVLLRMMKGDTGNLADIMAEEAGKVDGVDVNEFLTACLDGDFNLSLNMLIVAKPRIDELLSGIPYTKNMIPWVVSVYNGVSEWDPSATNYPVPMLYARFGDETHKIIITMFGHKFDDACHDRSENRFSLDSYGDDAIMELPRYEYDTHPGREAVSAPFVNRVLSNAELIGSMNHGMFRYEHNENLDTDDFNFSFMDDPTLPVSVIVSVSRAGFQQKQE